MTVKELKGMLDLVEDDSIDIYIECGNILHLLEAEDFSSTFSGDILIEVNTLLP